MAGGLNTNRADAKRMIARALKRHCPLCGRGRMFDGWFKLIDHCSSCGFRFDRNERDYFIGAYTINLIVAELLVVISMVIAIALTWPDVPWDRMKWIMVACMIPAPMITYPYSKTLWLAIDLVFQPPRPTEFSAHPGADSQS